MRQLSAKDRAFEKERLKFRQEIKSLKDKIDYLEKELHKEILIKEYYDECIEELEAEIKSHYSMTKEEFMQHVQRERKSSEALDKIIQLGKIAGGLYDRS